MFYIFPHVYIRCTWLYCERLAHGDWALVASHSTHCPIWYDSMNSLNVAGILGCADSDWHWRQCWLILMAMLISTNGDDAYSQSSLRDWLSILTMASAVMLVLIIGYLELAGIGIGIQFGILLLMDLRGLRTIKHCILYITTRDWKKKIDWLISIGMGALISWHQHGCSACSYFLHLQSTYWESWDMSQGNCWDF